VYELWTVAAGGSGAGLVAEGDYESPVGQLPAPAAGTQPPPSGSPPPAAGGTTTWKATAVTVRRSGARYVVMWKGTAATWLVTLRVGGKRATAEVPGTVHTHTFTLRGAKGPASATVKPV
jgi:hypothetical protein